MNGAEFRLKRMTLGLAVEELAERLNVDRRTVKRWETGYWEITPEAEAYLRGLWDAKLAMIDGVLEYLDGQEDAHGEPEAVDLTIYKSGESHHRADPGQTWGEHTASVGMIVTVLELYGYRVNVGYAPQE